MSELETSEWKLCIKPKGSCAIVWWWKCQGALFSKTCGFMWGHFLVRSLGDVLPQVCQKIWSSLLFHNSISFLSMIHVCKETNLLQQQLLICLVFSSVLNDASVQDGFDPWAKLGETMVVYELPAMQCRAVWAPAFANLFVTNKSIVCQVSFRPQGKECMSLKSFKASLKLPKLGSEERKLLHSSCFSCTSWLRPGHYKQT